MNNTYFSRKSCDRTVVNLFSFIIAFPLAAENENINNITNCEKIVKNRIKKRKEPVKQ